MTDKIEKTEEETAQEAELEELYDKMTDGTVTVDIMESDGKDTTTEEAQDSTPASEEEKPETEPTTPAPQPNEDLTEIKNILKDLRAENADLKARLDTELEAAAQKANTKPEEKPQEVPESELDEMSPAELTKHIVEKVSTNVGKLVDEKLKPFNERHEQSEREAYKKKVDEQKATLTEQVESARKKYADYNKYHDRVGEQVKPFVEKYGLPALLDRGIDSFYKGLKFDEAMEEKLKKEASKKSETKIEKPTTPASAAKEVTFGNEFEKALEMEGVSDEFFNSF